MTTGWTHLFSHRLDLAKEQFSLLPLVEGLRDLGWTAWLQSDWPALVNSWGRLLSEFPHDEAKAGLLPLLAEACDDIPKDIWLNERLASLEKRACPTDVTGRTSPCCHRRTASADSEPPGRRCYCYR